MVDIVAARHFSRKSASCYDEAAFVLRDMADQMIDRLQWMTIKPNDMLNIGARTGYLTEKLLRYFPGAQCTALDISEQMLARDASDKRSRPVVWDDIDELPFSSGSFDLVCANACDRWTQDLSHFFMCVSRVLKPNGLFLFSCFGPDTLRELRQACGDVGLLHCMSEYEDMHHVGDRLTEQRWEDVVMDNELIDVQYKQVDRLFLDLRQSACQNISLDRPKGLLTPRKWAQLKNAYPYEQERGAYFATVELVQGQAWKSVNQPNYAGNEGEVSVPIESIRVKGRKDEQ